MKPSMVPKRYCSFESGLDVDSNSQQEQEQQQQQQPDATRTPPVSRYDSSQRLDKAILMSRSPAAASEKADDAREEEGPPSAGQVRILPPSVMKYDSSQQLNKALESH